MGCSGPAAGDGAQCRCFPHASLDRHRLPGPLPGFLRLFAPWLAATLPFLAWPAAASGVAPEITQAAEIANGATGDATAPIQEIVIFGRAQRLVGTAEAASEGQVGGADLSVRPLLRVAELLEVVPGLIAAQHSGSGKANQYFLRGMQLDHGTDFTALIDGMPWNLRTHGHGQGYLDVNGLIPEVVDRIDYRKGPYRADLGDFALAGASLLHTIDSLPHPFVSVEGGGYGWGRIAGGGSLDVGHGQLTAIGQWKAYDGPWQLPERLQHGSLWSKYRDATAAGLLTLTVSGYHATWHPSEQIPESSVGTAACADAYCSLDPTAFGVTDRWIATAQLVRDELQASAWFQRYDWHMLSNPTYDYQINQFDHRWSGGGRWQQQLLHGPRLGLTVGAEARHDDIDHVGVEHAVAGAPVAPISDNTVLESSGALYGEANLQASDAVRLLLGLRLDAYRFAVTALNAKSPSGNRNDHQASPKFGLAWKLSPATELYANWGRGFHSNDGRGVVNADTPVPGLVAGTGYEAGARYERGTFRLTATAWWLDVASELIFVGDSNAVEPKDGARRHGLEFVAFWKPAAGIGLDAVYTASHARYARTQEDPDYDAAMTPSLQGTRVEGSVESAGELGISAVRGHWEASARLRYLGPYPLVPSGAKTAGAETMLNLRAAWRTGRWLLYAELLNALDARGKDIVYYYPSHIPGVLAPGEESATRMSRAEEPRTLRAGVRLDF
jgi:outer membrane receptor protein involved in Fe transport